MAVAARLPSLRWLQTAGDTPAERWRLLFLLNVYRQGLAALLTLLFFTGIGPRILGSYSPLLFSSTILFYLLAATLGNLMIALRRPGFEVQTFGQLLLDIVALTLLMHASGGLQSGLGALLVTTIAGASLLTAGRMAILYAALSSLGVLAQQLHTDLTGRTPSYTSAGLLGLGFFATAIVAHVLSRRLRESEALAEQRSIDLANLVQLTEFIIERMQTGVVVVNHDGRIRLMNESAAQLLGTGPISRHAGIAEVVPALATRLAHWQAHPDAPAHPLVSPDVPGEVLPRFAALGRAHDPGVIVFLEDRSLLVQQAQQMKLASLGRLTASIAHEIRNPLSAVSHAAELLGESLPPDAQTERLIHIIGTHTERMNRIVENVLSVSRRAHTHPEDLDLNQFVERFLAEFSATGELPEGQLRFERGEGELVVRMDPSQLTQVLWNLVANAVQHGAARAGRQGRVTLRALRDPVSRRIALDVEDDGPGIPEEFRRQIFEPFFTTEARGTGLGLYLSRELCEANQTQLDLLRTGPTGTTFRILFADPRRQTLMT